MTKEQFDNYKGVLHCKSCNKEVPNIHMDYKKICLNGDIARCNVCDWIKRHNGIPIIEGYTNKEILTTLYFFIYDESLYLKI